MDSELAGEKVFLSPISLSVLFFSSSLLVDGYGRGGCG